MDCHAVHAESRLRRFAPAPGNMHQTSQILPLKLTEGCVATYKLLRAFHMQPTSYASSDKIYLTDSCLSCPWAARYNTGLLIKLMPKGVVFSFLFFLPFLPCVPLSILGRDSRAGIQFNMGYWKTHQQPHKYSIQAHQVSSGQCTINTVNVLHTKWWKKGQPAPRPCSNQCK